MSNLQPRRFLRLIGRALVLLSPLLLAGDAPREAATVPYAYTVCVSVSSPPASAASPGRSATLPVLAGSWASCLSASVRTRSSAAQPVSPR